MLFELLLDFCWIVVIYVVAYQLWHTFLSRHANVLKDLFDIDVRYNGYNREESTNTQHEILYTLASSVMVICMVITPIIHSIIYLVLYNMVDIVQVNKILLTVVMTKILWFVNAMNKEFTMRPWKHVDEAFLLTQFVFIIINYDNTMSVLPSIFQIIDEIANLEHVIVTMSRHYSSLFNSDSELSRKITNTILTIKTNKKTLTILQTGSLSLVLIASIFYSNLKTTGELIFYYYATARILQINFQGI